MHETLERLIGRELAVRLERRPGQKEERYLQMLEDHDAEPASAGSSLPQAAVSAETLPVTAHTGRLASPAR